LPASCSIAHLDDEKAEWGDCQSEEGFAYMIHLALTIAAFLFLAWFFLQVTAVVLGIIFWTIAAISLGINWLWTQIRKELFGEL
jgi:hypothetical protein